MYLGMTDDSPTLVTCRSYQSAGSMCEEKCFKDLWYEIRVPLEVVNSSVLPRGISADS